jgi:hypothetical protein
VAAASDPVAEAIRRADLRALQAAIEELPAQQRDALVLRELGGLSYAELATALAVSGPAVESLLFRARRRLRRRLRAAFAAVSGASWLDTIVRLLAGGGAPAAAKVAAIGAGAAAIGGTAVVVPHVFDNHRPWRSPVSAPARSVRRPRHLRQKAAVPSPLPRQPAALVTRRAPVVHAAPAVHAAPVLHTAPAVESRHRDGGSPRPRNATRGDGESNDDRQAIPAAPPPVVTTSGEQSRGGDGPGDAPAVSRPDGGDGDGGPEVSSPPAAPATTAPAVTVASDGGAGSSGPDGSSGGDGGSGGGADDGGSGGGHDGGGD